MGKGSGAPVSVEDIPIEYRKAMYAAAVDALILRCEADSMDIDAKTGKHAGVQGRTVRHCIRSYEDYNESVEKISLLVQEAVDDHPGEELHLMLEIEGHKGPYGGFDWDMFQFQIHYVFEVLMGLLTTADTPLCKFGPFEEPAACF